MILSELNLIKEEIEKIKEYIASDLCKKCEEMSDRLKECEKILSQQNDTTNSK